MGRVEDVASACARVAGEARHVKIAHEKVPAYATFILKKYDPVTVLDPGLHHLPPDREETAAYVLALDSVNFGSGYFESTGLEYAAIAKGLKNAFLRDELRRPGQWAEVTPEYFSRLLAVPMSELTALFAKHLRQSGERILAGYQGKTMHLLEESGYSAPRLANIAASWENFRDASTYRGREIPFLKRAQILAADMHLALGGFGGLEKLTIFADNMVPHALRCDGILEYDAALAATVDGGAPLPAGSEQEVEIRASAIHAVELMKEALQNQGQPVTSVALDHRLWHRGYEPELYKKPRHRTLTTAY